MLCSSVVKHSGRGTIIAASALSPFLLMSLFGAYISYAAAQDDNGGVFFVGIGVAMLGTVMTVPGLLIGYLLARHLRPDG